MAELTDERLHSLLTELADEVRVEGRWDRIAAATDGAVTVVSLDRPHRRAGRAIASVAAVALLVAVVALVWRHRDPATVPSSPAPGTTTAPSTSTTTSTTAPPPTVAGVLPSQSPEDAARDQVVPAVAALSFEHRITIVTEPVYVGASIEHRTPEGRWVVSMLDYEDGDPGCGLGDPNGVYGRDIVCTDDYGEVLLLDSSGTKILRAYPFPATPPGQLLLTPDAVYCARQADGALPDSMICRIDRTTFEATVRVFDGVPTDDPGNEQGPTMLEGWSVSEETYIGGPLALVDGVLVAPGLDQQVRYDALTLEELHP